MTSIDKRAIVIGGSLGGLFTGVLLKSIGWTVDIYERSLNSLASRGGGIVLQPEILQAFNRVKITYELPFGVTAYRRLFLKPDGSIAEQMLMRQTQTSWNLIYGALSRHFPAAHYHQGKQLTDVQQDGEEVTAIFDDGTNASGDLLIGADGAGSMLRQKLLPEYNPSYAGYVAYRGLVSETELDRETADLLTESFVFQQIPNSHILQYLIPGENESLVPGERRFNWVWYVNYDEAKELPILLTDKNGKHHTYSIAPGAIAPEVEQQMRNYAQRVLAPPLQKLIAATKGPFIQSVLDLSVPQMAFNRIALVGDAAFIPRPHTASGVSKGAVNAIALADALVAHDHYVFEALKAWETDQLKFGMYLKDMGQALGNRSQFTYGKQRIENLADSAV
ncbi:MAG: FAD binding domain-containing protein [Cyanobacteria bacterium P01_G01_bin.67]